MQNNSLLLFLINSVEANEMQNRYPYPEKYQFNLSSKVTLWKLKVYPISIYLCLKGVLPFNWRHSSLNKYWSTTDISCSHVFTYVSPLIQVQIQYFQILGIFTSSGMWRQMQSILVFGWSKSEPCFYIYTSIIIDLPACWWSIKVIHQQIQSTIPWVHWSDQSSPLLKLLQLL